MLRLIAAAAFILVGTCGIARADVYRWVDDHGEAHYSDQWVPGSELIKSSRPHPPGDETSTPPAAKRPPAAQGPAAELKQAANAQAVKQDVAKARQQQCKDAKDRYEKAISARRIFKSVNKDGDREYLSDAEADAYRTQARNDVQDACGSVPAPQQ